MPRRRASSALLCIVAVAALSALGLGRAAPAPAAAPVIVSLEFDDGNAQSAVADLLARHGFHATFFINSGFLGRPGHFRWRDLTALQQAGHEIGGHTLTHPNLTLLTAAQQRRQICADRHALMSHGLNVSDFAYPYGQYTRTTKRLVESCGYATARRASGLKAPERVSVNRTMVTDPYAIAALPAPQDATTAATVEQAIAAAEARGGGWVQVYWHKICPGPETCGRFSWPVARLDETLAWLRGQVDADRVLVRTVRSAARAIPGR